MSPHSEPSHTDASAPTTKNGSTGPTGATGATGPTIFLHIGTTKSGTSYLQQILTRNDALLREHGVLSMNRGASLGRASRHVMARESETPDNSKTPDEPDNGVVEPVDDVDADIEVDAEIDPEIEPEIEPASDEWDTLVKRMLAWDGRSVVLSNELLSFSSDKKCGIIVRSLAPARVVVIITARDLVRVIPSAWQNKVKHGRGWLFDSFVTSIMKDSPNPHGAGRAFWKQHSIVDIARRWAEFVGPENVVVIPVPPRGAKPDELWRRFAGVLGVPADEFDSAQDQRSNLSVGFVEAELLRKLNRELRERMPKPLRTIFLQSYLANEIMRPDPDQPRSVTQPKLSAAAYDWAVERGARSVQGLRALGVRIAGEIDDLVPPPLTEAERAEAVANTDPPTIPDEVIHAMAKLVVRMVELEARIQGVANTAAVDPRLLRRNNKKDAKRDRKRLHARNERRAARLQAAAATYGTPTSAATGDNAGERAAAEGGVPEHETPRRRKFETETPADPPSARTRRW